LVRGVLGGINADLYGSGVAMGSAFPLQTPGVTSPAFGKNLLTNGDMMIAQRGTSFSPDQATGAMYNLDRWISYSNHNAGITPVTQETSIVPPGYTYSLKITNSNGEDTSLSSEQALFLGQRLEGYVVGQMMGRYVTVSFWVRSSKPGIYCVTFFNGQTPYYPAYTSEYRVNNANTWEKKSVTLLFNPSGTWAQTNAQGAYFLFSLGCGSTLQIPQANVWSNVGSGHATANQVNWLNEQNNTFYLAGVQIELGQQASQFDFRSYQEELALCQRYYQLHNHIWYMYSGYQAVVQQCVQHHVPMRAQPVLSMPSYTYYGSTTSITINVSTHMDSWIYYWGAAAGWNGGYASLVMNAEL
jgi:hypothetical protein